MGMDIGNVKAALRRKLQLTGRPFASTAALIEAVLAYEQQQEYYSDFDDDSDSSDDEQETLSRSDVVPNDPQSPSASFILASRLASAANASNQTYREEDFPPLEAPARRVSEAESSSGSDEEVLAGPRSEKSNGVKIRTTSSSSGNSCPSPSEDSGKFSLNVSSGEEDEQSHSNNRNLGGIDHKCKFNAN